MLFDCNLVKLSQSIISRNVRNINVVSTKAATSGIVSSKNDRVQPVQMSYNSYESTKPKPQPEPCPVIIMHGLLGSKSNWRSLSKMLHLKTQRKIVAVDARNHGDSPHTSELSYAHLAEDTRALMAGLKMPVASLVGHSMGGRAMMLTALTYPELVRSLVVVDISPIGTSRSIHLIATFLQAMRRIELPPGVPLLTAKKIADTQLSKIVYDVGIRQFLLTNLVEAEEGGCKWRVNLEAIEKNFGKHVANFPPVNKTYEGPTLFIAGAQSDYIRPTEHENIKKIFPAAEFEVIEGAGHWVHSDQPASFIQIVGSFLSRSACQ